MKPFYLSTMIFVFLLLSSNGIQAQTTQPKLNQIELMKQFLGNWKAEIGKDTTFITECISNPEKATVKWAFEFKSPDLLIWTDIVNRKATNNYT